MPSSPRICSTRSTCCSRRARPEPGLGQRPRTPTGVDLAGQSGIGATRSGRSAPTFEAYFDADRALRRTAEHLHVHVNTLVQRFDRVATLLGEGWQEPEPALEIQLALRLRRLLDPAARFG